MARFYDRIEPLIEAERLGPVLWRRRTAVWAYFNNDWRGFAPANATALARRLGVGSGAA